MEGADDGRAGDECGCRNKVPQQANHCRAGTACTETYLVAGHFGSEAEAINFAKYLRTRFVRFLVSLRKATQHATRDVYAFVPDLPSTRDWTDAKLYKRYGLTKAEIAFIESQVAEHDSELFDETAAEEIEGE